MTRNVSIHEAEAKLQDLLAQALAGNEVIITQHGKPVARLVPIPVAPTKKKRVAGLNRGTIWTKTLANLYRINSGWAKNESQFWSKLLL